MGAYMYPIKIKREPQEIRYHKSIVLDSDVLTLEILRKHVTEGEAFSVIYKEEYMFGGPYILSISCVRMETEEEVKVRVEKEELYMKNYHEFQSKHKK